MKLLHDWHIPDWDRHYENVILQYNNKWSYQQLQRDFALNKVKEWDIAIDIGANVGFWTKELCSEFRFVLCLIAKLYAGLNIILDLSEKSFFKLSIF